MSTQRKIFGRLPIYKGDWTEESIVKSKFRFTYKGSEFQSTIDENTLPPLDENDNLNPGWQCISNGTDAYKAAEQIADIESRTPDEVENPEFVSVTTDENGKILHAIRIDGTIYIPQLDNSVFNEQNKKIAETYAAIDRSHDSYNVSKYHTIKDWHNVYIANTNWEKVEYNASKDQYDPTDTYQIDEICNFYPDTNNSYKSLIKQKGNIPCIITQEYTTRKKFVFDEAIAILPKSLTNNMASGQRIMFVTPNNLVEEWQFEETGKPYTDKTSWTLFKLLSINDYNNLESRIPQDIKCEEFINIIVDSENKILEAIKSNGTKYIYKIDSPTLDTLKNSIIEYVDANKVQKEQNKTLIDFIFANANYSITECEYYNIVIDENNKIISAILKDGTTLLSSAQIDKLNVNSIIFSKKALTELEKALKDDGFTSNTGNWTDDDKIELPIPRKAAKLNIIMPVLPTSKTADYEGVAEYWDKDGNYFKKNIILNAQGNSTMVYIKKNFTIDFSDCAIKFGNWVEQDSFHLKANYIDVFVGYANIGYKYAEQIIKYLGCRPNRVIKGLEATTVTNGVGTFDFDFDTGALCHPDGFPVEIYWNGSYYGLYCFNLKKHRDNYQMHKKNYTQAILDGELGSATFFGGIINWTRFELRNPKTLICSDGTAYDGDNPKELIDSSSESYDDTNKDMKNTAIIKAKLQRQANAISIITSLDTLEEKKAKFEEYYDKKALSAYFIISNVIYNNDGFYKNWIWCLYDNIFSPTFYDLDSIFGRHWTGTSAQANTDLLGTDISIPSGLLYSLYTTEIKALYKELRDNNLISTKYIMSIVNDWIYYVGHSAYVRNNKKWTTIPSYRPYSEEGYNDGSKSYNVGNQGMYDSPKRIEKWLDARIANLDTAFNYNK